MSVPQMARARLVSRQHIQSHVNGLQREGLVELAENPAHKRSHLARLTPEGKEAVHSVKQREAELLVSPLPFHASALA